MRYQFIDRYRSLYRVEKMCRIFTISRSNYYTWKNRSKSMRDKENENLVFKIKLVHGKSRRIYGDYLSVVTHAGKDCTRTIIIASGAKLKKLGVRGETKFGYRGVSRSVLIVTVPFIKEKM